MPLKQSSIPDPEFVDACWQGLNCRYTPVKEVFDECLNYAFRVLSPAGLKQYLDGTALINQTGRGAEPVLSYLQIAPEIARLAGEEVLEPVAKSSWDIARSPNGKAIVPFIQCLPAVARRYPAGSCFKKFLRLVVDMMERTQGSIHGFHATMPSPGLIDFLHQVPMLVRQLSLQGIQSWVDYGITHHNNHPDHQQDYFKLVSADSRAIFQRERHGTLFADQERNLELYLRSLWNESDYLVPYSSAFNEGQNALPYYDHLGIRIPDVYDDAQGVSGKDRYRVTLAHMAAHRRWSGSIIADNFSPFQRAAIEILEDCRVEYLAMKKYPGLRPLFIRLHPKPVEGSCDDSQESCIRHRLAMLSYAILDENHGYKHQHILECVDKFYAAMQQGESSLKDMANIAVIFIARTRRQSDQQSSMRFIDTEVSFRDDNRHLWRFIEEGDEEEAFEEKRQLDPNDEQIDGLPPRLYHEWDYLSQSYKPDWVSVYEALHSSAKASDIDDILRRHNGLAKQLKRILDILKPQQLVRIRYQEDGSELDLDVALRSWVDMQSGSQPDPRINMSHKTDGRDIAVMLLLDLSESLNDKVPGSDQSILALSQEAVSLLAWSIEQLGDPLAIAGFNSNTRHGVHYLHIKGFSENFNDDVKGRLAGLKASYSTRMGAAMRHASHYLEKQQADKKLLLILTDGEPADIDMKDDQALIQDAHKAVQELDQKGIFSYCINLDPKADQYVKDIFGHQYTIIDDVEKLPEKLPELFVSLTK